MKYSTLFVFLGISTVASAQTINITGAVVDSATSRSISGALVKLVEIPQCSTRTNTTGAFTLTYTSTASAPMPFSIRSVEKISLEGNTLAVCGAGRSALVAVDVYDCNGKRAYHEQRIAGTTPKVAFPGLWQKPGLYLVTVGIGSKKFSFPTMGMGSFSIEPVQEKAAALSKISATYTLAVSAAGYFGKQVSMSSATGSAGTIRLAAGGAINIQNLMPVTWMTAIGGPQATNYASATWRQNAAKYNMILYTDWVGIEGAMSGQTMASSMADVKAHAAALGNPYCLTGVYQIPQEVRTTGAPNTAWFSACQTNHWWLYSGPGTFPGGSIVTDGTYGANEGNPVANPNGSAVTPLATSGWANGLDYCRAASVYEFNYIINGTPQNVGQSAGVASANPQCDFIIHDNQQWNTRYRGEWLCTSTVYGQGEWSTDTTVYPYQQAGFARLINKWRALCPNAGSGKALMQGGNCDWTAFGFPYNGVTVAQAFTASVHGLYDIPFSENTAGSTNPDLEYCSPNAYLARMVLQEQLKTSDPRAICILNNEVGPAPGLTWPAQSVANWSASVTATAGYATNTGGSSVFSGSCWQAARYIVCFALLRGWAVEFTYSVAEGNNPWMDEFYKGALQQWNWLGIPLDPPLTTTNLAQGPQGMYKRRFTNGTVWVNPPGNGSQTITATGHNLATAGYGDPAINNGATFTSFVMQNTDGRITLP